MSSQTDRVARVFEAAVVREPAERLAFVRDACADDPDVCRQVEAMLAAAERSIVIDRPVGEAIGQLFDEDNVVATGTRFGPYQVESLLGAGGMGEVYRATDTVLGRQVAIKILPADVSRDPERTARFRREAKILASLNHSNIGAIYGVETADPSTRSDQAGVELLGLVLELVDGPTLADRLKAGRLPVDEALAVARQIAEALDAAHQQGIVHRDLKPGNVKVRDDGVVKVLDFGLARVDQTQTDSSSGHLLAESPTITTPAMTAAGVLLGTAAYMAPEQAKGRPADKRSDIWAFGCVLYEMLTGTRAFGGNDVADTLAAVLRGEPDYTQLPRDTPEPVRALLRGCLTKDRHRRLSDVSAVRFVFENMSSLAAARPVPGQPVSFWRRAALPAASAALLAAMVGVIVWYLNRPAGLAVIQYDITPSGDAAVQIDVISRDLAVLPNGSVVFKGVGPPGASSNFYIRTPDHMEPRLLLSTGVPRAPFASPDGERIGFIEVGGSSAPEMKSMPVSGGPSIRLCGLDSPSAGATWGEDNHIIFATTNPLTGLQRVPATGGEPEILTKPDANRGEGDHFWPQYLPGARAVLFTITPLPNRRDLSQIAVLDLTTGRRKVLSQLQGGSQAQYTSSGHLVFVVGTTLFAVPFDLGSLELRGSPTPLPTQVATIGNGTAEFDIGRDGTLAHLPVGSRATTSRLPVWVDRKGAVEPIKGALAREYLHPRLSPDGTKLAAYVGDQDNDIYVWDLLRNRASQVTFESGAQVAPAWLDNQHLAYTSQTGGTIGSNFGALFRRAINGTGGAEPLLPDDASAALTLATSVCGNKLLASTLSTSAIDIMQLDLGRRRLSDWWKTSFVERNAEFSPDCKWVAFEAANPAQSIELNVYVRPFDNPGSAIKRISPNGGRQPAWSRDGKEIFFVALDGSLHAAAAEPDDTWGSPMRIVDAGYYDGVNAAGIFAARMYDVAKDGRFLMLRDTAADSSAPRASIIVSHNWVQQLKRLVPSK